MMSCSGEGAVYKVLANRVYLGEAVHKGLTYPGEHAAIVDQRTWDKAHAVMAEPARRRGAATRAQVPALLKGLIHGPNGRPMSPSHTRRRGRIYRYYVTREAIADGYDTCPVTSVPAADVEGAVVGQVQKLLATPEVVARTWAAAKRDGKNETTEREVTALLAEFAKLWNELFPAEQARMVQLLVERVDVQVNALEVRIKAEGLVSLVGERRLPDDRRAA
jgi:site-specific DNA recombinase